MLIVESLKRPARTHLRKKANVPETKGRSVVRWAMMVVAALLIGVQLAQLVSNALSLGWELGGFTIIVVVVLFIGGLVWAGMEGVAQKRFTDAKLKELLAESS